MIKILFICHGNICRSPMAEFVMNDLVRKAGLEDCIEVASAATSTEEIGNPVYPPAKRRLAHTAGAPILAQEHIEGYFPVLSDQLPAGDVFMLHVKGDSMINAGIYDGDDVIIRRQSEARNGEIVAALIDDSATIKTYYKEKNCIRLQPENDLLSPILVKDCTILGKLVALYRKF